MEIFQSKKIMIKLLKIEKSGKTNIRTNLYARIRHKKEWRMILVFNIFKFIGIFMAVIMGMITVFMMLIIISKIEVNIKKFHISKNVNNNINKKINNNGNNNWKNRRTFLKISLKIGNFQWLWINLDKSKLAKIQEKLKEQEEKNKQIKEKVNREIKNDLKLIIKNKKLRKELKDIKPQLKRFKANIQISTKDYIITSYLVAIISIVISNIVPHLVNEKQKRETKEIIKNINYKINPIYIYQNYYDIRLSMIIDVSIFKILKFLIALVKISRKISKTV